MCLRVWNNNPQKSQFSKICQLAGCCLELFQLDFLKVRIHIRVLASTAEPSNDYPRKIKADFCIFVDFEIDKYTKTRFNFKVRIYICVLASNAEPSSDYPRKIKADFCIFVDFQATNRQKYKNLLQFYEDNHYLARQYSRVHKCVSPP